MSDSSQRLFAVALNSADSSEPDNYWIEFYRAESDEDAEQQAQNAHPTSAILSTPTEVPNQTFDSTNLPEGLYAEVNSEGMVIRDCQEWTWVTCHNGYDGDPPEWRAEVRRRVLTAFGLPHSASMSESS